MKKPYHIIASFVCLMVFALSLAGCGLTKPSKMQPTILQPIEVNDKTVGASVATTVERRIFYVNLHGDKTGKFCAEPPPDAAESIASSFAAAINASTGSNAANPELTAAITKSFSNTMTTLSKRSQGIIIYRDGMFNLCQAYLNDVIDKQMYADKSAELLEKSFTLITKELEMAEGRVGPLPTKPEQASATSSLQETQNVTAVAVKAAQEATKAAVENVQKGGDPKTAITGAQKAIEKAVDTGVTTLQTKESSATAVSNAIQKTGEKAAEVVKEEIKKEEVKKEDAKKSGGTQ